MGLTCTRQQAALYEGKGTIVCTSIRWTYDEPGSLPGMLPCQTSGAKTLKAASLFSFGVFTFE